MLHFLIEWKRFQLYLEGAGNMLEIGELIKEGKSKRIYATNDPEAAEQIDEQFPEGMFRFEKRREGSHEADIE